MKMNLMAIIGWMGLGGILSWLIFYGPMTANAIRMARKTTAMARQSSNLYREGAAAFKGATEQLKRATDLEEQGQKQVHGCLETLIEQRAKIDFAKERLPSLRDEWLALPEEDHMAFKKKAEKALFGEKSQKS